MLKDLRFFWLVLCVMVGAGVTRTAGPAFWTVATAPEFLKGKSDGASISSEGVVSAGPQFASRMTSTPAQVWSIAEGADGTVWAGTGGDGRVLRLRPGQPEQTVFDADEANVFAVAVSGTRVYAATSPDGRVYVIEGDTPARPFFDPSEKYIWSLAVDNAGRLWVGAGNPAVVYRVDPTGTGRPLYRPPAAHVVALAREADGRMLAGTESPGRLYRFGSDDRPFALLDTGLTELRAIAAMPDGAVYAAGMQRADGTTAETAPTAAAALAAPPPSTPPATTPPATQKSVVFRIDAAGGWESAWETTDLVYDLTAADDNSVLIATGPEGRLYRLDRARAVLLVTGVDAKQITRFGGRPRAGARVGTIATANPGRVLAPGAPDQSQATLISAVRDSKSIATWGLIRWESAGAVTLFTRSGNTEAPDDSWSDWSGPYATSSGEAIKSPAARFIQWKVVLSPRSSDPAGSRLTSVTVAYLPRNVRPVVSSVTTYPPGTVFQRPFSSDDGAIAGMDDVTAEARRPAGDAAPTSPSPGRRMFQRGLQTVAWKAEDTDGDRLTFALQYRREGETGWRDLRSGLLDPLYVWDTSTVADGRYVIRVVASDAAGNSTDRALSGERDSDLIHVDNTPPEITIEPGKTGAGARLAVRVRDSQSAIQKLEYSIAGGAWQVVYPVDQLADSPDERYEIALPAGTDISRVVLRATDQLQNVASAVAGR